MLPGNRSSDGREARRLRGGDVVQRGWKQKDGADAVGVSKGAVSQGVRRAKEGGSQALRHTTSPGAPARLTPEQKAQLPGLLAPGAPPCGVRGDRGTLPRGAEILERAFGVAYAPSPVWRILKRCGLSLQTPLLRASQRDEEARHRWKEEQGPALKKRLRKRAAPECWWMQRGFPGCRRSCTPGRPADRRLSCGTS